MTAQLKRLKSCSFIYWCITLLSPGREALTLHKLLAETPARALPFPLDEQTPCPCHPLVSSSWCLHSCATAYSKKLTLPQVNSGTVSSILPIWVNPPTIAAWTSWEQAQRGLSAAAAHKVSSGSAISRRRSTLRLEAASLIVYITCTQTKTTGGKSAFTAKWVACY